MVLEQAWVMLEPVGIRRCRTIFWQFKTRLDTENPTADSETDERRCYRVYALLQPRKASYCQR